MWLERKREIACVYLPKGWCLHQEIEQVPMKTIVLSNLTESCIIMIIHSWQMAIWLNISNIFLNN